MKLNNKFEIKERPHGYEMVQKKPTIKDPETLDELKVKVMSIRDLIVSLKAEIRQERGIIRNVKP